MAQSHTFRFTNPPLHLVRDGRPHPSFQRNIRQETTIFELSTMVEQLNQKMSMMEAGTGPMLAATTGSVYAYSFNSCTMLRVDVTVTAPLA